MNKDIFKQSCIDLTEDFDELLYLISSSKKQLKTFQKDIEKQKKHILSFEVVMDTIKQYEKEYEKITKELQEIRSFLSHLVSSTDDEKKREKMLHSLSEKKEVYGDVYRSLHSMIAGLITSTDWQSPSFAYSKRSLAGRQTGNIRAYYNDYKRDHHSDAKNYAEAFRKEYVDALVKFTIPTYLTNSGMAALTTILAFLQMEKKITGPILLGSSSYFQNKELIKKQFSDVSEIHEHDTEAIKAFIQTKKPSVLFFDSLCNSYDIAIPNLKEIVATLKKTKQKDVYIIVDNTCLAASFQPLQLLGKFPKNIHMIVFESLNKYHQFGMDRTMGGVIYGFGKDMHTLFLTRQHSGTILSDVGCFLLPTPHRKFLQKRLARHERNAKILVEACTLAKQTVVYPLLSSHPAHTWSNKLSFRGSYFTFSWKSKQDTIKTYKKFIANVLQEAKKQHVQLVEGTSFGMNISRLYLTASTTKFGRPFVRFSVGTETRYEIEKIKEVLLKVLEKI